MINMKLISSSILIAVVLAAPTYARQAEPVDQPVFVPRAQGALATIELRPIARVYGSQVTLKQVGRWSRNDIPYFDALQDLVIAQVSPGREGVVISHEQIRTTLHDAGVNLASIRFTGAASVSITVSTAASPTAGQRLPEALRITGERSTANDSGENSGKHSAIDNVIVAQAANADHNTNSAMSTSDNADLIAAAVANQDETVSGELVGPRLPTQARQPIQPLREHVETTDLRTMLVNELANRSRMKLEQLQIEFAEKDRGVLALTSPQFRFDVKPRMSVLGPVSWQVTVGAGSESRRIQIDAQARAWVEEVVVVRPVAMQQVIGEADIEVRRALIDALPVDELVTRVNASGMQASRDLKPGTVLTGRMVRSPELVRAGQLVTVTPNSGQVQVTAVAKAMSGGTKGQTIKVQNQSTRQTFDVVVTGPQEAALGGDKRGNGAGAVTSVEE